MGGRLGVRGGGEGGEVMSEIFVFILSEDRVGIVRYMSCC